MIYIPRDCLTGTGTIVWLFKFIREVQLLYRIWAKSIASNSQQIQQALEVYTVIGVYWGNSWPKHTTVKSLI